MTSTFFGADWHHDHDFMRRLRGFETVEEMNEAILDNHNAVVGKRDTFYFLGDLSFGLAEDVRKFYARMNGVKHLIVGNHDAAKVRNLSWSSVNDLSRISVNGQKIVLAHYPLLTWQNAHHGTWHLHGHSHGNGRWADSTRIDVGIDCSERHGLGAFMPFSYDDVAAIMATREYDYIDHHDGGEARRAGRLQDI